MFSMQSVSENTLIATFQLSSAASLNLGRSQNGVLGNGLNEMKVSRHNFFPTCSIACSTQLSVGTLM